jgi:hypothetical protein
MSLLWGCCHLAVITLAILFFSQPFFTRGVSLTSFLSRLVAIFRQKKKESCHKPASKQAGKEGLENQMGGSQRCVSSYSNLQGPESRETGVSLEDV